MSRAGTSPVLKCLQEALATQDFYLAAYRQPSEPLAYETLRTLDDLFCRDLMQPSRRIDKREQQFRQISGWGVNHALRRIVPKVPSDRSFVDFPSHIAIQAQADDFVFNCGALELAERFEGRLREGVLSGELREYPVSEREGIDQVLILRSVISSSSDEEIGLSGLRWASSMGMAEDKAEERAIEERHLELEPELARRVSLVGGWRPSYTSNEEIDTHFHECARLYLRRIFSQDMIAREDIIGGRPFSRYVEVLTALSAQSQKRIAFAAILKGRHPDVHIRNLLTTHSARETLTEGIARSFGADLVEIKAILESLILAGGNLDAHTLGASTAWAPVVQASANTLLLPVYGLDINPFLFLLTDLRNRYATDWFRVANNRERRWITDIEQLFSASRWQTHGRNLRLRENGRDVTDIDFAAFEQNANELALFQLKWQHPVGLDNRGRRSAGRNLLEESNRWIESVLSWIERHGVAELVRRLGFNKSVTPTVYLFVLGRYHVHLTGFDQRDPRAVWADWAHLQWALSEVGETATVSHITSALRTKVDQSRARKADESMAFPVGRLAIVLNPTSVPPITD